MKKVFSLMASAAVFTLIACSADGVMDKGVGDEQGSIASKVVAEAEAQRAAITSKGGDGCSVSRSSGLVKVEMKYMGISETISVKDNGDYATISAVSDNKDGLAEFCEDFTEEYELTDNAQCTVTTGEVSFDVPYDEGLQFVDAYEGFKEYCDEMNKSIAEEEKAKAAEKKDDKGSSQKSSGNSDDGRNDDDGDDEWEDGDDDEWEIGAGDDEYPALEEDFELD